MALSGGWVGGVRGGVRGGGLLIRGFVGLGSEVKRGEVTNVCSGVCCGVGFEGGKCGCVWVSVVVVRWRRGWGLVGGVWLMMGGEVMRRNGERRGGDGRFDCAGGGVVWLVGVVLVLAGVVGFYGCGEGAVVWVGWFGGCVAEMVDCVGGVKCAVVCMGRGYGWKWGVKGWAILVMGFVVELWDDKGNRPLKDDKSEVTGIKILDDLDLRIEKLEKILNKAKKKMVLKKGKRKW
ncbi:hypothetical protein Tco_0558896 [Tanacetum coccineum]